MTVIAVAATAALLLLALVYAGGRDREGGSRAYEALCGLMAIAVFVAWGLWAVAGG